jgi:hypothetical protein
MFLAKFLAPIPWMLEAAIVLQIALGAYVEATMIATLLLFNAVLGVVQEGRAGAALAALKQRLAPTALVCRAGVLQVGQDFAGGGRKNHSGGEVLDGADERRLGLKFTAATALRTAAATGINV